ncbi:MAG: flagellar export chaperone FliS [Bryobacteraceae bacterium]|jgi:flagellar protein FliS
MFDGIATYFESSVLSADPVELVRMLYRGAIEAVEKARQHLRERDIAARSAQLTKAGRIIVELMHSVNKDADPRLSQRLLALYDYMQRRLIRGNLDQADGPLAEVVQLLRTLLEAWDQCGAAETAPAATIPAGEPETIAAPAPGPVAEYATTYGSGYGSGYSGDYSGQSWSL